MTTGRINQIAIVYRVHQKSRDKTEQTHRGQRLRRRIDAPSAGLKRADTALTRKDRVHASDHGCEAERPGNENGQSSEYRGLHAPTKARQITRCGPTAHRESGDSARQFVKPPYEQDACAIISSRQRLLASDTYTGAPTPYAVTKML